MIPRFSRPEMTAIWEPENRFKIWLEIEMLVCEAQAEIGVIPKDSPAKIRAKAKFDIKRIDEIEDRDVGADPDPQRSHRDGSEPRRSSQRTSAQAEVLKKRFEPGARSRGAC